MGAKVVQIYWDSVSATFHVLRVLADTAPGYNQNSVNRISDGRADASGRLFFGTANRLVLPGVYTYTSAFYSKQKKTPMLVIRKNVGLSNGIAWDRSNHVMFYTDTYTGCVEVMNFDLKTGLVCKRYHTTNFSAIE